MNEKEIIAAAAALFLKYGIKSLTMDEMARQMGVSKKTIYVHFKDKHELVEKTLQDIQCMKHSGMDAIMDRGLNAIEEIFELYHHVNKMMREYNPTLDFDLKRYYPKLYARFREEQRESTYEALINNLNKGIKEKLYRADLDASIIARLHVIRLENMMENDLISHEELYSKKFFLEVFKYHLYGTISTEGLKFVKTHFPEFFKND